MFDEDRNETVRRLITSMLEQRPATALEISKNVRISEKEVYEHLPHVGRSAASKEKLLKIHPPECFKCGFVFTGRTRFKPPGRCPECKSTRTSRPGFEIVIGRAGPRGRNAR